MNAALFNVTVSQRLPVASKLLSARVSVAVIGSGHSVTVRHRPVRSPHGAQLIHQPANGSSKSSSIEEG